MKLKIFLFSVVILFFNTDLTHAKADNEKVIVCYVASWANYRPSHGKFDTPDIQPELCTHLVYAFAGLNATTWTIKSLDPWRDTESGGIGNYRAMVKLREKHPDLTVSLAIGGWNEGSRNYSELCKFPERREKFVNSVVDFLGKYGFNGFDLDWEFPSHRGGDKTDKENFVALIKELRKAFRGKQYHLTAAISANLQTIDDGYNITELSNYLDYIHVMTYDYHSSWEQRVLPNTPLRSKDGISVEKTLKYLLNKGAAANKLVMGLAFYGRTFVLNTTLLSPEESPIGKPCTPDGFKGPYTGQDGFMGYNEICEELVNNPKNWRTGWYDEGSVPYMVNDDRVVIYDDPSSIKKKIELAKQLNLGGVMVWSMDTDDFRGKCATLNRRGLDPSIASTFPLMRTINNALASGQKSYAATLSFSYMLLLLTFVRLYL